MAVLHNQPLSLLEEQPRLPARGGSTKIRRFNGITRKTHDWDGLRKVTKHCRSVLDNVLTIARMPSCGSRMAIVWCICTLMEHLNVDLV